MSANFFVGEYGSVLRVVMPFDTTGSTVTMLITKPAGVMATWSPDVAVNGSVERTLVDGDIAEVGVYKGVVVAQYASARRKAIFSFLVGPA